MDQIKAIRLSALLQVAASSILHLDNKLFLLNSIQNNGWDETAHALAIEDCTSQLKQAKADYCRYLAEIEGKVNA